MSKSYGEQFNEALACSTQAEADAWIEKEIQQYHEEHGINAEQAKKTILVNLGYMAGYYDKAASEKIYRLFGAEHPIFGKPDYWDKVTPEQAFRVGQEMAKKV